MTRNRKGLRVVAQPQLLMLTRENHLLRVLISQMREVVECASVDQAMSRYRSGDHVKVEFIDEESGQREWMWIEVDHADDENRLVFGRLDAQPILNSGVRLGQQLAVSYAEILDHRRFAKPTDPNGKAIRWTV
jgi:hypothetical protein